MSRVAQEVRNIPCPQCLAPGGEVCRTRTGRWLRPGYEHMARWYTAWADLIAANSAATPEHRQEDG